MAPTDRSKSSNHWCITISNTRVDRNLMARYFVGFFWASKHKFYVSI